jgi:hypothetical protein
MRPLKRFGLCTVSALALAIALAAGGGAEGGAGAAGINPQGHPKNFKEGKVTGYAVWHSKKGWHLRTTTRKREHQFRGHIRVEGGTVVKIHSYHLEKEGKLEDRWKVGPKRHTITFDFKTDKGIDGINFTVSKKAMRIRFDLHVDGKNEPGHVFVGSAGIHPDQIPFELVAHPLKK